MSAVRGTPFVALETADAASEITFTHEENDSDMNDSNRGIDVIEEVDIEIDTMEDVEHIATPYAYSSLRTENKLDGVELTSI